MVKDNSKLFLLDPSTVTSLIFTIEGQREDHEQED
jgi:hypothetical protein